MKPYYLPYDTSAFLRSLIECVVEMFKITLEVIRFNYIEWRRDARKENTRER